MNPTPKKKRFNAFGLMNSPMMQRMGAISGNQQLDGNMSLAMFDDPAKAVAAFRELMFSGKSKNFTPNLKVKDALSKYTNNNYDLNLPFKDKTLGKLSKQEQLQLEQEIAKRENIEVYNTLLKPLYETPITPLLMRSNTIPRDNTRITPYQWGGFLDPFKKMNNAWNDVWGSQNIFDTEYWRANRFMNNQALYPNYFDPLNPKIPNRDTTVPNPNPKYDGTPLTSENFKYVYPGVDFSGFVGQNNWDYGYGSQTGQKDKPITNETFSPNGSITNNLSGIFSGLNAINSYKPQEKLFTTKGIKGYVQYGGYTPQYQKGGPIDAYGFFSSKFPNINNEISRDSFTKLSGEEQRSYLEPYALQYQQQGNQKLDSLTANGGEIIDSWENPLYSEVNEKIVQQNQKKQEFEQRFGEARKSGEKIFEFDGKFYSSEMGVNPSSNKTMKTINKKTTGPIGQLQFGGGIPKMQNPIEGYKNLLKKLEVDKAFSKLKTYEKDSKKFYDLKDPRDSAVYNINNLANSNPKVVEAMGPYLNKLETLTPQDLSSFMSTINEPIGLSNAGSYKKNIQNLIKKTGLKKEEIDTILKKGNVGWLPRKIAGLMYQNGGLVNNTGYTPGFQSMQNPFNIIPTNNITMKNTPFPLMGYGDGGEKALMRPGNNYLFPNSKNVLEVPFKAQFGSFVPNLPLPPMLDEADAIRYNDPTQVVRMLQENPKMLERLPDFPRNKSFTTREQVPIEEVPDLPERESSPSSSLEAAIKQLSNEKPFYLDNNEILITDNDKEWDYRKINGQWQTRRKGANAWITPKGTALDHIKNKFENIPLPQRSGTKTKSISNKEEIVPIQRGDELFWQSMKGPGEKTSKTIDNPKLENNKPVYGDKYLLTKPSLEETPIYKILKQKGNSIKPKSTGYLSLRDSPNPKNSIQKEEDILQKLINKEISYDEAKAVIPTLGMKGTGLTTPTDSPLEWGLGIGIGKGAKWVAGKTIGGPKSLVTGKTPGTVVNTTTGKTFVQKGSDLIDETGSVFNKAGVKIKEGSSQTANSVKEFFKRGESIDKQKMNDLFIANYNKAGKRVNSKGKFEKVPEFQDTRGGLQKMMEDGNLLKSTSSIVKSAVKSGKKLTKEAYNKLTETDQKTYDKFFKNIRTDIQIPKDKPLASKIFQERSNRGPATSWNGFKYGGAVPKYQYGGVVNSVDDYNTTVIDPNSNDEYSAVQTEVGETVLLPNGNLVKVKADKLHKHMKDDQITDILPVGSYIYSNDKKMMLSKDQAIKGLKLYDIIMGKPIIEYKENDNTKGLEDLKFSDIFGAKKALTPAKISEKIKTKFKLEDDFDYFTERSNRENKEQRSEYFKILTQLSEAKKPGKKQTEMFKYGGYTVPKASIGELLYYTTPIGWAGQLFAQRAKNKEKDVVAQDKAHLTGIYDEYGTQAGKADDLSVFGNVATLASGLNAPLQKTNDYVTEMSRLKAYNNRANLMLRNSIQQPNSSAANYLSANPRLDMASMLASNVNNTNSLNANINDRIASNLLREGEGLNNYTSMGEEQRNRALYDRDMLVYGAANQGVAGIGQSLTDRQNNIAERGLDKSMNLFQFDLLGRDRIRNAGDLVRGRWVNGLDTAGNLALAAYTGGLFGNTRKEAGEVAKITSPSANLQNRRLESTSSILRPNNNPILQRYNDLSIQNIINPMYRKPSISNTWG